MVYDSLTEKQKQLVDLLMEMRSLPGHESASFDRPDMSPNYARKLAGVCGCGERTMKARLQQLYRRYGIACEGRYWPMVRLVFLRAIELELMNAWPNPI